MSRGAPWLGSAAEKPRRAVERWGRGAQLAPPHPGHERETREIHRRRGGPRSKGRPRRTRTPRPRRRGSAEDRGAVRRTRTACACPSTSIAGPLLSAVWSRMFRGAAKSRSSGPSRPARACSSTRSCCWGRRTVRPRAERLEARPPPGARRGRKERQGGAAARGSAYNFRYGPRPKRWADAVGQLRTLQAEHEAWRDQLPGSPAHDAHAGIMENPT